MKRILIVEDDRSNELILRQVVRSLDQNALVDWVDSAETATLLLAQENSAGRSYQLVLADIFLAGKNTGLDLWSLREEFFPFTPVVLTSSMPKNNILSFLPARAPRPPFLQKPVPVDEWKRIFRSYL